MTDDILLDLVTCHETCRGGLADLGGEWTARRTESMRPGIWLSPKSTRAGGPAASSNQSLCRVADSRSHRIGRPSRLTPVVRERLLHALRTGNARVVACRYAGISEPTFHRWMADDRPEFREFREVVEQAEAAAEVGVVANLVELSKRDHRDPIRA